MTGPEHYRKAEEWARYAEDWYRTGRDEEMATAAAAAAVGQLHATLALAAATAMNPTGEDFVPDRYWPEFEAWARVCAVNPPASEQSTPDKTASPGA